MNFPGAAFTAAVCWALGTILFRRLRLALRPGEHQLQAGLTGAAMLSFAVFILCALRLAYAPVFLAFALLLAWPRWRAAAPVFVFYAIDSPLAANMRAERSREAPASKNR